MADRCPKSHVWTWKGSIGGRRKDGKKEMGVRTAWEEEKPRGGACKRTVPCTSKTKQRCETSVEGKRGKKRGARRRHLAKKQTKRSGIRGAKANRTK